MPGQPSRLFALCGIFALAACGAQPTLPEAAPPQETADAGILTPLAVRLAAGDIQPLCAAPEPGKHHCLGYSVTSSGLRHIHSISLGERRSYGGNAFRRFGGNITGNFLPPGYGPSDLQKAYGIAGVSGGSGRTVALVEAGDAPTLENDLNVYRAQYRMPLCTTANGCLRKIGQDGSANLPAYDPNWQGETQLDAQMVSALCQNCRILVVEAKNEGLGLDMAENTAAQAGAFAISNSWGGAEDTSEAPYFHHPGITITAASGDGGYRGGTQSPADFPMVIAVGGTSLMRANTPRGWSETVWNGSGAGCSLVISKPSWQTDPGCSMRTIADVAFVADPATGVAMYDSNPQDAGSGPVGWRVAGGTSIGAPAVAALFALAGISADNASTFYGSSLNDIVSGSDGACATPYLCNGAIGYDGPTGNGTPNGIGSL